VQVEKETLLLVRRDDYGKRIDWHGIVYYGVTCIIFGCYVKNDGPSYRLPSSNCTAFYGNSSYS